MVELQILQDELTGAIIPMKAGPSSPQPQKYTNGTPEDELGPKVPFQTLQRKSSQRQSAGLEPGNVPWPPLSGA